MTRWRTQLQLFLTIHGFSSFLFHPHVSGWSAIRTFQRLSRAVRRRTDIVEFSPYQDETAVHDFFMKMALDQATKAAMKNEVPVGAVVVLPLDKTYRYKILARAHNQVETKQDASAHAELLAVRQASSQQNNWRLLDCTLYSTLEPCSMCLSVCQAARIASIVYAAPDLRLGAITTHMKLLETPHPFHNISKVISGVQANTSSTLLQNFFRQRRKASKQRKKSP